MSLDFFILHLLQRLRRMVLRAPVLHLELQLLVEAVDHLAVRAGDEVLRGLLGMLFVGVHGVEGMRFPSRA